jgi:hypothetical protein
MTVAVDLAVEPIPAADGATTAYQRRPFALFITLWGFGASLLWLGFPMAFVLAFFLVGGSSIPLVAVIWIIAIGLIFGLAGLPLVLHGLARVRSAHGDPVLLKVGPTGLWLRDSGQLGWWQIAGIRVGSVDVVQQRQSDRLPPPRLEVVPVDRSHLAGRPWFVAADQGLRGLIRRFKPYGDRAPLRAGFQLDLDLLDADPRAVIEEIARHRPVDGRDLAHG